MADFFHNSTYYGAATIFRRYARLPAAVPLPFGWQHGWTRAKHPHDALPDAVENWMWTAARAEEFAAAFPECRFRAAGAPFAYLHKLLGPARPAVPRGSIFFPAHSSPHCNTSFDSAQLIDRIKALPAEFHPVTMSVYFLDIERGRHLPYVAAGFPIVSNGSSLTDPAFYSNFIAHALPRRFALSNAPTSALLYTELLGLESFYLPQPTQYQNREPLLDIAPLVARMQAEFAAIFSMDRPDRKRAREFPVYELGVRHIPSRRAAARLAGRLMLSPRYLARLAGPPARRAEHAARRILGRPKRWLLGQAS